MSLAFIGPGRTGSGMARNLVRAGHSVALFNRTRDKTEVLASQSGGSAKVADSPAAAVREAEAVFTMLADDSAAEQIVFGEDGILAALALRDDPPASEPALRPSTRVKQQYVSAPVLGRPETAEEAKLLVVRGGRRRCD